MRKAICFKLLASGLFSFGRKISRQFKIIRAVLKRIKGRSKKSHVDKNKYKMPSYLKLNLLVDQFALNKMKTIVYSKIVSARIALGM